MGQGEGLTTGCPTLVQPPACRVTPGKGSPFSEPQQSVHQASCLPLLCGFPCRQAAKQGQGWAEAQEADGSDTRGAGSLEPLAFPSCAHCLVAMSPEPGRWTLPHPLLF